MTIPMLRALAAGAVPKPPVVTLSGETGISDDTIQPDVGQVGVRFNQDGTIDKNEGGAYFQIDSATDWIIPNGAASDKDYHVKCTDNNANLAGGSDSTGSWLQLTGVGGSDRQWYITNALAAPKLLDLTIEISDDGGSTTLDSANYTGSCLAEP